MPHYWFSVPLETAPHLADAKARGGAPAVRRELARDAQSRGKSLVGAFFAQGLGSCAAQVYSADPMSREECEWFLERWEAKGTCEPRLEADETVLDEPGWMFESSSEEPEASA